MRLHLLLVAAGLGLLAPPSASADCATGGKDWEIDWLCSHEGLESNGSLAYCVADAGCPADPTACAFAGKDWEITWRCGSGGVGVQAAFKSCTDRLPCDPHPAVCGGLEPDLRIGCPP